MDDRLFASEGGKDFISTQQYNVICKSVGRRPALQAKTKKYTLASFDLMK